MGYGKGTEGGKEWDRYPPHLRIPPTFQPRGCTYGCAYNAPCMTVDSCRQSTLHPFSAARLLHCPRAAHNSACKASVWSLSVCLSETPDYPHAAAVVQRTAVTLIKNLWPAYVSAFLSEVRHIGFFVVYPPVFATVRSAQLQTMRAGGPSAVCAYRHISLYIVYGVVRHIHSPRHQKR